MARRAATRRAARSSPKKRKSDAFATNARITAAHTASQAASKPAWLEKIYAPSSVKRETRAKALFSTSTSAQMLLKPTNQGVLVRSTARAKRDLKQMAVKPNQIKGPSVLDSVPFRVMDLPSEFRQQIWKYVVACPGEFIWPATPIGAEQPDLAMVSREIRNEVLPIYYGGNVFAIELSSRDPWPHYLQDSTLVHSDQPSRSLPLPALAKWCAVLQDGNWLRYVRRWIFSGCPWTTTISQVHFQTDLVVLVETSWTYDAKIWTGSVEIHNDAFCVQSGMSDRHVCIVQETPQWLNEALFKRLDQTDESGLQAEMIVGFAKAVKDRQGDLLACQCRRL